MTIQVVPVGSSRPVQVVQLAAPSLTVVPVPGGGSTITEPIQHLHVQNLAATVWTITHNLGRRPAAVALFSLDWLQQFSQYVVQHLDEDTLRVSMDVATAGNALVE